VGYLGKISVNFVGYVQPVKKKTYVSHLSKRPICNILGTGKGINSKLLWPLLLFRAGKGAIGTIWSNHRNCEMFLTIPASLASGERSFSSLKPIKTKYVISTVNKDRLNSLVILLTVSKDTAFRKHLLNKI